MLVLRGSPDITGYSDYLSMASDDRDKAMLAGDNGAAGLILVSGTGFDKDDKLVPVNRKGLLWNSCDPNNQEISRLLADPI